MLALVTDRADSEWFTATRALVCFSAACNSSLRNSRSFALLITLACMVNISSARCRKKVEPRGILSEACYQPSGLIFKERHVGNALVLASVSGILSAASRAQFASRYFSAAVLVVAIAVGVFIISQHDAFGAHCISMAARGRKPGGKGLQASRRGGAGQRRPYCKGPGCTGRQKLRFLPGASHRLHFLHLARRGVGSDCTCWVIAAFVVIVFCGLYIAMNAADPWVAARIGLPF